MSYIFIDESGQFTKYRNKNYFVIAAFSVKDPRITAKRFRSWCRNHFPRKMRDQNEIKWSTSTINDNLRLKTLKQISKFDIVVNFVYLHYKNIPIDYRLKEKLLRGLLYTDMICSLLQPYLTKTCKEFRIFCDRRELGNMSVVEFRKILYTRLALYLSEQTLLNIEMVDSASNVNTQIADWIVGAIARYLEKDRFGEEFYEIIKENIVICEKDFATKNP